MNSKHAYDLLIQDLNAQIAEATKNRDEKAETKAKKLQARADAEGDLTDTTTTRDADAKYLSDLVATCEQKATDFESRQELRAQELVAVEEAIKIISSGAVAGNAEKHLPTLVQQGASLVSLRSDSSGQLAQERAAQYLRARASELDSRVLSAIA